MNQHRKQLLFSLYSLVEILRVKNVFGVIKNPIPRDSVPVGVSIVNDSTVSIILESAEFPECKIPPLVDSPIFQAVHAVAVFYMIPPGSSVPTIHGVFPVGEKAEEYEKEHPDMSKDVVAFNRGMP